MFVTMWKSLWIPAFVSPPRRCSTRNQKDQAKNSEQSDLLYNNKSELKPPLELKSYLKEQLRKIKGEK